MKACLVAEFEPNHDTWMYVRVEGPPSEVIYLLSPFILCCLSFILIPFNWYLW
jgi:hypothetical protein